MKKLLLYIPVAFLLSCSTTNYYIVRHAEKKAAANMMTSDVPLTEEGAQRAIALRDELKNKNIRLIYSTNYIRTKSTAQPLSDAIKVQTQTYDVRDTLFVRQLKSIKGKNVLVVGHSNTVDDLVNGVTGKPLLQDLPDSQYGDLFIIKKKGDNYQLEQSHFGKK